MFVPRSPWCMHSYWVWLVFFPEHHACSEAQYYLLKEMTETFPRVKRQKKEKEKLEILYGFQAWYALESFSLVKLVLERHGFKVALVVAHVMPVHRIRTCQASAAFCRGCGSVCNYSWRTSCTQSELVECQSESFHLFKTWTSIFYS